MALEFLFPPEDLGEISVRRYDPSDYPEIESWFKDHGFVPVPRAAIANTSFISEFGGSKIAFCSLYSDKENLISFLTWVVVNPQVDKELRSPGIDIVIEDAIKFSKENKHKFIFTVTNHSMLTERFEKFGFKITDKGSNEMIYPVGGD